MSHTSELTFPETVQHLMAGDFSFLAPLFETRPDGAPSPIIKWFDDGAFADEPQALDEAFTCACFNGCTSVVEHLLAAGVNPSGGINTGLNALHWAANRGQCQALEILIQHNASLETRNAYGGTVLGGTVWSAIHEPRPGQLQAIEALLNAGASVDAVDYPTGNETIDALLQHFGPKPKQ